MDIKELVYSIMVYTLIITSVLLFSRSKKHLSVIFLGVYSLFQVICVVGNFIHINSEFVFKYCPKLFFLPTPFLSAIIPLFYLFIKTSVYPFSIFNKKWIWHFALFTCVFLFIFFSYLIRSDNELRLLLSSNAPRLKVESIVLNVVFNLQYLFYSILLIVELRKLYRFKQKLLHTVFSHVLLKFIIYAYLGGCVISLMVNIFRYFGISGSIDFHFLNSVYFYIFFLILFYITIKGYSIGDFFKYGGSEVATEELNSFYHIIMEKVKKFKPYLEPVVTLKDFASSIEMNSRMVSQAINHGYGGNFNEFMNFYRVEHAKNLLRQSQELNIQEVMFLSGFNSKATFNKAFKDLTQKTPTQYKSDFK